MLRTNLERKNRPSHCTFDAIRTILRTLGGRCDGILIQRDIYFPCAQGRLKLRLLGDERAELIAYDRTGDEGIQVSSYRRTEVSPQLEETLRSALGVRAVVSKRRELWLWHNVRIHLDEVEHLGGFIEFEAVLDEENDEAVSLVRLENLGNALGLRMSEDISCGYVDLLSGSRKLEVVSPMPVK
jgi:predicted adenylyl cyclase CyaB